MLNTVKKRNKEEKAKYRIPKKVQDLIPIQTIWNDGIFKTDNKYSKTYRFTDINFQVASETDKQSMLEKYAKMICVWYIACAICGGCCSACLPCVR